MINVINNSYQQISRVLYTFGPNKLFGKLLDISLTNFLFLKTIDSVFLNIEMWFANQISKSLEIDHKISITLVFK